MNLKDAKPFCKVGDKLEFEVVSITDLFGTIHYSMQSNDINVLFKNSNPEQESWKPKMVEAEAMQWIPCSERLPEACGEYITSREYYEGYEIQILVFDPKQDFDVEFWKDEIDAWMPLPEPYKEEE